MHTTQSRTGMTAIWHLALSIALSAVLALLLCGWFGVQEAAAADPIDVEVSIVDNVGQPACSGTPDCPDPSVVGQTYAVEFEVRVTGDNPDGLTPYGTTTVSDGHGGTCQRTVTSGDFPYGYSWDCSLTSSVAGNLTLTATFVPLYPAQFNGDSDTEPHQVLKANTTTVLTSSPNPSAEDQEVTLTATVSAVSPGGGTPVGTVSFYVDGELLATRTLNTSGVATFNTSSLGLGTHVLTAEYSGNANYYASESGEVTQETLDADLTIIKMVEPDGEVRAGESVVYTVLVDNLGPGTAFNLVVNDTMTASGSYTVQSIAPDLGGSCTPAAPASSSGTNNQVAIECTLAELQVHERWTIVITAVANQTTDINNVASVYAELPSDPNLDNNYVEGAIAVTDVADLDLVKAANTGSVMAGEEASWTVIVANYGPSPAENLQVVDMLPAGLVDGSLIVSAVGCTLGTPGDPTDPLVCNLGTLGVDDEVSFTVTGTVDPASVLNQPDSAAYDLDNDAWALSDTFDPDNSNNRGRDYVDVQAEADLSLLKFAVGTPIAGTDIHYEYQIANFGPSWSGDVTLRDALPSQVEFQSAYVDREGGTGGVPLPCDVTAGSNTLFCPLGDIPLTGSMPIVVFVNVRIKPDATGSLINSADLDLKDTFDPISTNDSATVTTVLQYEADLSIEKTSEPMKLYPGEQKTYHIEVTNNGPSGAPDVLVTDTLPPLTTYEIDNGDCELVSSDPDVLECYLGYMGPGETKGFDVWALVSPDAPAGEITNEAQVSTVEGYDPDETNNSASATNLVLVPVMADLSVSKAEEHPVCAYFEDEWDGNSEMIEIDAPCAGRPLTYVLTVANSGPLTAPNVVLEELLPEGVTVVGVSPDQGSCTTGIPGDPSAPLICNLGDLLPDTSTTVEVSVEIDRDLPLTECGEFVINGVPVCVAKMENDAVVYSDIYDPDNGDNRAYLVLDVYGASGLEVSKTAFPDPVQAGEDLDYTVTVINKGPSVAQDVVFTDRLPGNPGDLTLTAFDFLRGAGTCTYVASLNAVQCALNDLPVWDQVNPQATVVLHFTVNPGVEDATTWDNCLVRGDDWEASSFVFPKPHDVCATTTVENVADLSVSKTADPWKVFAGEQVMYDVSVTNYGPGNAYQVLVTDTLPAEVGFELSTDPDCYLADGDVLCEWNMLRVGQTRSFQIFGRVDPSAEPATVSNRVWVNSLTASDPVDYNDYASAPILIQGKADLKVQKFGKPDGQVYAGEELTYTVIVDNLGPGYAHDVVLKDVLKSSGSFDLLSVTSDRDASCAPETGTFTQSLELTCSLTDTLDVMSPEPGAGRWTLTVVVQAAERQDIDNVARVAASDLDPDPSNNEAVAEHEITAVADLELLNLVLGEVPSGCAGALELRQDEVAAGATMTYTLQVTNLGPSTAVNVQLQDPQLPPLVEIQSVTPSKGTCNTGPDGNQLTCGLGNLAPGASARVDVKANVPSWVVDGTIIRNDARVFSDVYDDDNGNNLPTNWTTITRWADLMVEKTQEPEISFPSWDITYTITVTNLGPSDAEGLLISDTIPVQVLDPTWTCCASDDGDCDIPCEPPTCPEEPCPWPDIGLYAQADIPAGDWAIYTVNGTLDWWPCGPFTNTVTLIPPESLTYPPEDIDPCDENNTDIAVNDPFCHYDPLVLKVFPGPDSIP